jgi:hypothetical protein
MINLIFLRSSNEEDAYPRCSMRTNIWMKDETEEQLLYRKMPYRGIKSYGMYI